MNQHDKEQKQYELNERLVSQEILCNVSPMVEFLLCVEEDRSGNEPPFSYDDIENLYAKGKERESESDDEPQEIYEWWAVSKWLYEKLRDAGEPVIDSYPCLWGRTTTGQAIALDSVISRIQQSTKYGSVNK